MATPWDIVGRELKRVPEHFDWPLGQPWTGYVSPFRFPPCTRCTYPGSSRPTGLTPEAHAIAGTFYASGIGGDLSAAKALAWHDKLVQAEVDFLVARGRLHVWRPEAGWVSVPRSAAEVNATERAPGFGEHDVVNRDLLVRFRCERLGIPVDCPTCGGHGDIATPDHRAIVETWTPTDPPSGPWYQIWETVSEGSPISPPFATPEMLARWCSENPYGTEDAGYEDWLAFINGPGTAPTFVVTRAPAASAAFDPEDETGAP